MLQNYYMMWVWLYCMLELSYVLVHGVEHLQSANVAMAGFCCYGGVLFAMAGFFQML
jgi:hypothetical protein